LFESKFIAGIVKSEAITLRICYDLQALITFDCIDIFCGHFDSIEQRNSVVGLNPDFFAVVDSALNTRSVAIYAVT